MTHYLNKDTNEHFYDGRRVQEIYKDGIFQFRCSWSEMMTTLKHIMKDGDTYQEQGDVGRYSVILNYEETKAELGWN